MKKSQQDIDKEFRTMMETTRIQAPVNLKFRIMQQLMTETSLLHRKSVQSKRLFSNLLGILGAMYALILVAVAIVYFDKGTRGFDLGTIYPIAILITLVCVMFYLILLFDERRRSQHRR